LGVAEAVGVGVGLGVGDSVGVGLGVGDSVGVGVGVALGASDWASAIAIEARSVDPIDGLPDRPLADMTGIPADRAQAASTRASTAVNSRRLGSLGRALEIPRPAPTGAAMRAATPEPNHPKKRRGQARGPGRVRWAILRASSAAWGSGWAIGRSTARAAALAGTASLNGPERSLRLLTSA
jgi:hypothetical protein